MPTPASQVSKAMVPTDGHSSPLSNSENESFTGAAKSNLTSTLHSGVPKASMEVTESDMRAIHQSGELSITTSKNGASLAERRSTTQTPLQLDLGLYRSAIPDPHTLHLERSQAIDIPVVRKNRTDPTTPLTARAEKSGNLSYFQPSHGSPLRSPSLRPRYYLTPVRRDFAGSSVLPDDSPTSGSSNSSSISTTSTSSVTSTNAFQPGSIDSIRLHRQRLTQVGRSISGPAGHLSAMEPSTPTKPKPPSLGRVLRSPQLHHRQVSDAQRKLQQYQRDLIANATRTLGLPGSSGGRLEKPDTPHLKACGSPGIGPATPLLLEDPTDYLSAGITRSNDYLPAGLARSSAGAADGLSRDLVDQLLRREESRLTSGMSPKGGSPAVSPAGGAGL